MNLRSTLTLAGLLVALSASAQNYLVNPGFETWTPNDDGLYNYTQTGVGFNGCGANGWDFYSFTATTTTVERVAPPAGLTGSGNYSAFVQVGAVGDGIGQETEQTLQGMQGQPVPYNFVSGWVYVTSGSVGIGWFNQVAQQTNIVASTSTLNQWVFLSSSLPAVQSSAFEIIATSSNTSFYADNMDADATPEPGTFAILGLGALGLLRRRRR